MLCAARIAYVAMVYGEPISFVDAQLVQGGDGTSREYVRQLIRKDADRLQSLGLLLEGAAPLGCLRSSAVD